MRTNQKYNRAMRDGFMVKPSKPQAIICSHQIQKEARRNINAKR
ncbi:hypothetical protein AB6H26_06705 [Providencia hangzhouensis]|nr:MULTISPECIES: hypothetical protein [Providencia]MCS4544252.1 hypothetical protein [Providencia rettgeri]MCW4540016.1 hypothetical protein [Providencia rettgeri]MDB9557777.1 hypothetical protein [Providencia rettgeri]MDH2377393.1 hypothetical protein [Providencia rettgeri]MDX4116528.1 hypothetical protein [Providencia rettgeri]